MNEDRISKSEKKSLSEYNTLELRGWIIEQFCKIEFQINQIIINHIKPVNCEDFERIILNSSILSFGNKIKILKNVKDFDQKTIGKLQKAASIRNIFAHASIYESIEIDFDEEYNINNIDVSCKIDIMTSDEKISSQNVVKKLDEYYDLTNSIIEDLSKSLPNVHLDAPC
ncbi:hypothetical protein G9H64_03575 [Aquirufa nivalisilvae]|uniref:hypothetical protein n=1 Tax=Aquirufa nivalisilvae TaxID=2516557 RepID=UPI0022A93D18|nr:hypothetical protein [Aquirufa nivalisilvae]MCZ2482028.1 hypothetical protein [Aquirufa nivalisilvae]